jgi:hypothetical protein
MTQADDVSWWVEIATAGERPGLSLFEDLDTEHPRSMFERFKSLFASKRRLPKYEQVDEAGAAGVREGDVDAYDRDEAEAWRRRREDDEYEDHSESGWGARRAAGQVEDEDDYLETIVTVGVIVVILVLIYLRGIWVQQQERERGNQPRGVPPLVDR